MISSRKLLNFSVDSSLYNTQWKKIGNREEKEKLKWREIEGKTDSHRDKRGKSMKAERECKREKEKKRGEKSMVLMYRTRHI